MPASSIDRTKDFTSVLIADLSTASQRVAVDDTPGSRRDLVRTSLAGVEGMIWFLKVQVFERRRTVSSVSQIELNAIFERSYAVAENGSVREIAKFLPTLTTIRMLAAVIARDFPTFDPDFKGESWRRVRAAIEIRHRITHPKSVSDLDITSEDAKSAEAAFNWVLAFVQLAAAAGAFG